MDTDLVQPFSPTLSEEQPATTTIVEESQKQAGSPDNEENKPTALPAELMPAPQPQERIKSGEHPVLLVRNFIVHTKAPLKLSFTQN